MLQPCRPQTAANSHPTREPVLLQLLLFVDERPSSRETSQQIQDYLRQEASRPFELQVIEIGKEPHLVEHFRLVATPALVKIAPQPQQTLAGSNLIAQLQKWWPQWQLLLGEEPSAPALGQVSEPSGETTSALAVVGYSAEMMRLGDEIFRLKQEKEELLEQLQFKEQILAMLAHDLRSPLTAASIAMETLELTQTQEATLAIHLQEQLYAQARKQFRIMNRMITDLLQASKNMSAKLKIEPQRLSLQSLCQEIVPLFGERCCRKSQVFEQDIPQDLPLVFGDRELIRQVIINLLENANKYTQEGGQIRLSILHRTMQKIQVSVCDNGPGIPQEKQERIFEGHFRLQRDEAKEGYGLGLALCRKIVRAHYGQIWVDSAPDRGSCFHFTLPVCR